MNTADSERLAGLLERYGLKPAGRWQEADIIVLNSCSVRQAAEDKVYGWGKKLKMQINNDQENKNQRSNNQRSEETKERLTMSVERGATGDTEKSLKLKAHNSPLVVLTGCMVGSVRGERQRFSEAELRRRASFVDYVLELDEWEERLPEILHQISNIQFSPSNNQFSTGNFQTIPNTQFPIPKRAEGEHAYVKISEGCDNFCTYCVVPYGRGREVSRTQEEIITEVKDLVKNGFNHITLLGQNVNSWGIADAEQKKQIRINSEAELPFASLLRELHELEDLDKLSFLTANPFDFTLDLVETLALPKLDRYLHMAVQSGSDTVLQRMNRRHTIAEYCKLIAAIRARVPDMELGTDIIVGFPGETEAEFEETVKLVREIRYDNVYVAMYSPRPGTYAAKKYTDDVPKEEKKRRYQLIANLVNSTTDNMLI